MSTVWTQLRLDIGTGSGLHPSKAAALARRIQPGWQNRAACAGQEDPDLYFPAPRAPREQLAPMLTVCAGCPVRRSCLAGGLLGCEYGIWGGTTEAERDEALGRLRHGARVDEVLDQTLSAASAEAAEGGQAA